MKTRKTFKLVLALLIAGLVVSCNPSARNNRDENSRVDSMEVMGMNNARHDETRVRAWNEMERMRTRLDSLDENDPDFNVKLNRELDRFKADMDSLEYRLRYDNVEMDEDLRNMYDSARSKSNELKKKLKRWADKTGENLEELGNDIKREFRELKESLRTDNK